MQLPFSGLKFKLAQAARNRRLQQTRVRKVSHNQKLKSTAGKNFLPNIKISWWVKLLLILGLLGVVTGFGVGLYGIISLQKLRFDKGKPVVPSQEWSGKDNLNILLIGMDDKQEGLEFVDSLQMVYIQPQLKEVNILAIDPELSVRVDQGEEGSLGQESKVTYQYKQLYNYYKSQDLINNTNEALPNFIFTIESEIGVNIDKYIILRKGDFASFLKPYYRLPVKGVDSLTVDQQLAYVSDDQVDSDEKLVRQGEVVRSYLLSIDNPIISSQFGILSIVDQNYSKLLQSNFNGKEAWRLYKFLRGLNKFDVTTGITKENEKFILNNQKFLDKTLFDENIRKLYQDQLVLEEQGRIDVINGSNRPNLAGKTRRILTNHSFNIVRIDNSDEVFTHTTLYITEPRSYPETIHQLRLFYPDLEIKTEEYKYRPTGDMVLVVI